MDSGFSFQIRRNYHPQNQAASDLGTFSQTQFLVVRTAPKRGYSLLERNGLLSFHGRCSSVERTGSTTFCGRSLPWLQPNCTFMKKFQRLTTTIETRFAR